MAQKKGCSLCGAPFLPSLSEFRPQIVGPIPVPRREPHLPLNGSKKFTLWFDSNLHNAVTGGPTWIRTRDRPVMSRWLCQLSYGPFASMISIPFNDVYRREFCLYMGLNLLCQGKYPRGCCLPAARLRFPSPSSTLSSAINKTLEFLAPAGVSKLSQGLGFDLPDALPGYQKILPHLL